MARGYPDFFGFSVFPQYGPFTEEHGAPVDILAGNTRDFFELTAKGVIYDGYHRIYSCADPSNILINVTVDGDLIPSVSPDVLLRYNLTSEGDYLISLKEYNPELGEYIVALRRGTTFSGTFKTTIINDSAGDITVISILQWANLR